MISCVFWNSEKNKADTQYLTSEFLGKAVEYDLPAVLYKKKK